MVTNSAGAFQFLHIKPGKYTLSIKFIGYKQKQLAIDINQQKALNLGTILITPVDQQLEQVTVRGSQAAQQHRIDRQTYQGSQYKNAVGGTALDVVKNLHRQRWMQMAISVCVKYRRYCFNQWQTVFPRSGNHPQPDCCKRCIEVEYITSRPRNLTPTEKAGMINIKTKKAAADGFAWVLNLQAGLPSIDDYDNRESQKRYGGDIAFQYRKDKLELNGSANYLRNDNAGFRDGDVNTIIGDRQTFFHLRRAKF